MSRISSLVWTFRDALRRDESGQGLVEYALVLVLVAVVAIAVLVVLGPNIRSVFSEIATEIGGGPGGTPHPCEPWPNCG